jgi:hypothetical protein
MVGTQFAFCQFAAATRGKGTLVLCLALCTLGAGHSTNVQERKARFITFDAPGGTGGWGVRPPVLALGGIGVAVAQRPSPKVLRPPAALTPAWRSPCGSTTTLEYPVRS